jgi:hypothetical protein
LISSNVFTLPCPLLGHIQHILEVMRRPLEDKVVTISRAQGTLTFPANFMLIAAMNPCSCGYPALPPRRPTGTKSRVRASEARCLGKPFRCPDPRSLVGPARSTTCEKWAEVVIYWVVVYLSPTPWSTLGASIDSPNPFALPQMRPQALSASLFRASSWAPTLASRLTTGWRKLGFEYGNSRRAGPRGSLAQ